MNRHNESIAADRLQQQDGSSNHITRQRRPHETPTDSNRCDGNNGDNHQPNDRSKAAASLLDELAYCVASFSAVFTPVSLTMIISALVVVYINTDATRTAGADAYANTYEAVDLEEGNSRQNFFASLLNTFIIVIAVGCMTFVVVLLYKYRCMKCLIGYMILVTTMLLGFYSSIIWRLAIDIYGWSVDAFTYYFLIYNFAAVGTAAIFYGKGIPLWVTQGYLIASSVILAWQLSFFGDWTAWTLLVMLALYDLFAVLAPCGPLKALVNQMSQPNAPELPSLLYEAPLPRNVRKPNQNNANTDANSPQQDATEANDATSAIVSTEVPTSRDQNSNTTTAHRQSPPAKEARAERSTVPTLPGDEPATYGKTQNIPENIPRSSEVHLASGECKEDDDTEAQTRSTRDASANIRHYGSIELSLLQNQTENRQQQQQQQPPQPRRIRRIPLAIAKLYKLDIIDTDASLQSKPGFFGKRKRRNNAVEPREYTKDEVQSTKWDPWQLKSEVQVDFSMRGGWIDRADESQRPTDTDDELRYIAYRANGDVARSFFVNENGEVYQVRKNQDSDGARSKADNSIKLGLGDFIFYSILVSKAALHSFTTFSACMVAILTGLGGTLGLLAINGKALPALPISIFLGVFFFLMTRLLIEPWIHNVLREPFYV